MEINNRNSKLYWAYLAGFFLILLTPLFVLPPWFFPIDWGKTVIFRSILSILALLFIFQLLFRRNEIALPDIKRNKIIWVLVALFIVVSLAMLFSADINFSLWGSPYRAGGAVNFIFYILFGVLAFLIIKNSDWNKIINFSFFTGILVCFVAIIQFYSLFSNIFIPIPGRPTSTMGNPIMLAVYLLLLAFLALSFAIKEERKSYKLFYCLSFLIFLYVILITGSRAAYLGLLFGALYFILFYPKKLLIPKLSVAVVLVLGVFAVYYINSNAHLPKFLEDNRIFQAIQPRLSLKLIAADPRFSAWKVGLESIKEKPILGWGPENFAIGFDKYYDPSLPYISKAWGGWWDRAHNIFLDISVTIGIPALIIYLTLLATLFAGLQKLKKNRDSKVAHGIQATLVAYLVANTFSFDAFASYLIFFLLISYSLYLIWSNSAGPTLISGQNTSKPWKKITMAFLFIAIAVFLWQYNFIPLKINSQIQKAKFLADAQKCEQAFNIMDKILPQHSFLDAYARIQYVENIKTCAEFYPEKNLEYAKRGAELMKEAVKTRPIYSRLWLFLGSFTTIEANAEQNSEMKKNMLSEANSYFEKASQLAPNHQEILIEWAKTDMVAGNYQAMKEKSDKCASLDPTLGECYWLKALSEIYLKEFNNAKINILKAEENRFNTEATLALYQLINAYIAIENYKGIAIIYKKLIEMRPDMPEYHSSLAFAYSKMGEYKKAREEAMKFLELMPEAKEEVNLFLKTLPY